MTREEEIKERLENNDYMDPGKFLDQAPEDLRYLLARNEELQRRVEKLEAGLEMILTRKMSMALDCNHLLRQIYQIARNTLDAKDQDDDRNES